jgi:acyl-CoA synthetase (AMP-forming)/AMP-acid ligase II
MAGAAGGMKDVPETVAAHPMPGTEIKIAADGEIMVKGPSVMQGYHNEPEETGPSWTDGSPPVISVTSMIMVTCGSPIARRT